MTPLQTIRLHEAAVRRIAWQSALQSGADREDLIQDGFVALLEMQIDESTSERQQHAYAERRLLGAMLDSFRAADPCPRSVRKTLRDAATAERCLSAQFGRQPTDAEIAAAAGIQLDDLFAARNAAHEATPLAPPDEGMDDYQAVDELFLAEHATGEFADPADIVALGDMRKRLAGAIAALPARLRDVMVARLVKDRTLVEIAADMGVSESRVCQLQKEAVRRLRAALTER